MRLVEQHARIVFRVSRLFNASVEMGIGNLLTSNGCRKETGQGRNRLRQRRGEYEQDTLSFLVLMKIKFCVAASAIFQPPLEASHLSCRNRISLAARRVRERCRNLNPEHTRRPLRESGDA